MNTKKVFFGLLGFAFLAMAAVATPIVEIDEDQKTSIRRDQVKKL